MLPPLILTLKIDDESFDFFDVLRRKYFPLERNFLRAHVTLFHHLSGENIKKISEDMERLCAETTSFSLRFTNWRFLGKGSAMNIEADELLGLRARLAGLWKEGLTPQDRQKFQPHITVQNKVMSDEARKTFEELSNCWTERTGKAEGLTLWHYIAPRWKFEADFLFEK